MKDMIFIGGSNHNAKSIYKLNGIVTTLSIFLPLFSSLFLIPNKLYLLGIEVLILYVLNVYLFLKMTFLKKLILSDEKKHFENAYAMNYLVAYFYVFLGYIFISFYALVNFSEILFYVVAFLGLIFVIIYSIFKLKIITREEDLESISIIKSNNEFYIIKLFSYNIVSKPIKLTCKGGNFIDGYFELSPNRRICYEDLEKFLSIADGYINVLNKIKEKNPIYIDKNGYDIYEINNSKYGYIYLKDVRYVKSNEFYIWLSYIKDDKRVVKKFINCFCDLKKEFLN